VSLFLIERAAVGCYSVSIKFFRTVKISSLKNENFTLFTTAATPSQISAPFELINTLKDYNQISRILTLYWKTNSLQENSKYSIKVQNIIDSSGTIIPTEIIEFTWLNCTATPNSTQISEPVLSPVLIEDRSIKADIDFSYSIIAKNPNFFIDQTFPGDGEFYLENNYNNGRVTVVFNERPASNFLTNKYFQCQRKKIQKTPCRWETVTADIKMHSWKPEVYVDFPSLNDATPSYFTDGKQYFEKGYKYRVKVLGSIGI